MMTVSFQAIGLPEYPRSMGVPLNSCQRSCDQSTCPVFLSRQSRWARMPTAYTASAVTSGVACAMAKLVQFTRYLVGQAMAFDVQVFLRAREVPYCRLDDEGVDAPRLGEMAWLKTREFQTERKSTRLNSSHL